MKLIHGCVKGQSPHLGTLLGNRIADPQATLGATLTRCGVLRAQETTGLGRLENVVKDA